MLNLTAPINKLGYGKVGTEVCVHLMKKGLRVNLFPIGPLDVEKRNQEIIYQAISNSNLKLDKVSPSLRIYHQNDIMHHVGKGPHIGWPIFELNRFTEIETRNIANVDKLIVCSEWAKSLVEKINPNSYVVPLGYNPTIFSPIKSNRKSTVFLNVGKWEVRKGHDILYKIFDAAFEHEDNVELWMMNHNPFLNQSEEFAFIERYKSSKLHNKIRYIPRLSSELDVARVMQQADAGIFPSRAEGWNLEALEMLACGKYVIATNYSGHTEFLNKDNALLVDVNRLVPAYDGKWFFSQGDWASLESKEIEEFAKHLRFVHERKQNDEIKTFTTDFTWEKTANKLIEVIFGG